MWAIIAGAAWLAAIAGITALFGANARADEEDERLERDLATRRRAA